MKFTDDLQRKKLGMKVDVFIGPFFSGIYLFVSVSLWGFRRLAPTLFSVSCGDCGVHYIGETGQHFFDRRTQTERYKEWKDNKWFI